MLAPNYIIPSRKTISNSLLLQIYESVLEKVKIDLQSVKALSLTTYGWTSINNQHYIALTVHFINSETKLCSRFIGCINYNEKCTSQELSDFLMATVKKWNIENKISAVVTDNAPNIVGAIKLNNWRHISCFAHVLNIGIQHGLEKLKPIINKIKSIVEFFKLSSGACHKLQNIQKQNGFNNSLNCISDDEWEVVYSACKLLKVFDELTTEMSPENVVTISKQNLFYIFLL